MNYEFHGPFGSSSWLVRFECEVCGAPGARRILKRRVRKHQEELKSPVRVTLAFRCPCCGIKGHHGVRINGNRVYPPQHRGVS